MELDEPGLEDLLAYLRDSRGIDFTDYKRPSLARRIGRRAEIVKCDSFGAYRDYLEVHPQEVPNLFDAILINVTRFFRDEEAWTYLAAEVVPTILESRQSHEPIRIWSAGCASGEEPYSLAMLLAEALGTESISERVKIYATDLDDAALSQARAGKYEEERMEGVSDERRVRHFDRTAEGFVLKPELRRSVIFGRHDLTIDAPISRLDLLVCRNTLMYLVGDAQRRILARFHYALAPGSFLFLGKAETMMIHSDLFAPTSVPHRIFTRSPGLARVVSRAAMADDLEAAAAYPPIHELALAAAPIAQLVVDVNGLLLSVNNRGRGLFGLSDRDVGTPFRDLEISYRPVELRSLMEQAYTDRQPIRVADVERPMAEGRSQFFEVNVSPLVGASGSPVGASITFTDITELGRLRRDLERSRQELETSNEELQSTNEELETSNEELQSTNEELETTNEELQSANEELETINEELQSANSELEEMNEHLQLQQAEIERGSTFLSSILSSITVGVAVVDADLNIVVWNRAAEHQWGLRAEEVIGRSILALDIGLPVGGLGPALHELIGADEREPYEQILEAVNRRGLHVSCLVSVQRLMANEERIDGLVILMSELPKESP